MRSSRLFLFSASLSLLIASCGGETAGDNASPSSDSGGVEVDSSGNVVDDAGQGAFDGTLPPTPSDGGPDSTLTDAPPVDDASDSASPDSSLDASPPDEGGPLADATSDGETYDAAIPLDAADAGIDSSTDAADDASVVDAGLPDGFAPDPVTPCEGAARDIFYVNSATAGPFSGGSVIVTNLGANWSLSTSPLDVQAGGDSLRFTLPDGGPPVPGHYVLGTATSAGLELAEMGDGCSVVSGALDVLDYATYVTDAGTTLPSSILLSYSLECWFSPAAIPVQGCMKYAIAPVDLTPPDAGPSDAGALAPCQSGGDVFYVNPQGGFAGLSGPIAVTSASGTWAVGLPGGGPLLQAEVTDSNMAPWQLVMETASFAPGTYTSSGTDLITPWIQVEANGVACSGVPTGTFSIVSIDAPNDQLQKVVVGFDLACPGGGTLTGCMSYAQ